MNVMRASKHLSRGLTPFLVSLLVACEPVETPRQMFSHELASEPTPWTHDVFDAAPDKFTFGIISDLTGGERAQVFQVAVDQLSLLRPELILSVGDLIDGASQDSALLAAEWDWFDDRASELQAPLFRVGGNHDLTGPALRKIWEERHGPRYYHFVYKDVLFLILDTEDHTAAKMEEIMTARNEYIDSLAIVGFDAVREMPYFQMRERVTGEIGPEQAEWARQAIAEHDDVRWTMLFMHKPVWLEDGDEDFVSIEQALQGRPYTVFNGHLHNMSYTERHGQDYIMLGTTGGSQRPEGDMAFDHISLVTMDSIGPSIVHLRLDGVLDKTGALPEDGETLCFQLATCETGSP